MKNKTIACWWSGGVTSAVACKLAADIYGLENCRFVFIDTANEDEDTYRFKADCEAWYGKEIETITRIGQDYGSIQEVWEKYNSLNVAHGAICSTVLKREIRIAWQKENKVDHQVFGFEFNTREAARAISIALNYPDARPIFPLLMYAYRKKDCIKLIEDAGIEIPRAYQYGFHNNNCLQTGCVQGGVGYWQKMAKEFPEKFDAMAAMEHRLTDRAGKPVTMNKDQSQAAKITGKFQVFLKPHPDYPAYKDISQIKGRPPAPLVECNGFCGTYDLEPKRENGQMAINFEF